MVKHLPTMRDTQIQSLGREDPLEKEMAPQYSTLAWKIPWTIQSMGSQRVGQTERLSLSLLVFPVAQMVKNSPLVQKTQVQSLGREDPLEKEMATHSSILA